MKVVIVGGVAGGATCAARLRRLDENAQIVVLERTGYVSYANCGLPYYIGGEISDREELTLQTPSSFKSRFDIDVRIRNEVRSIDRERKVVEVTNLETDEEYEESYDKLVLSPGAVPLVPDLSGVDSERIFELRTVENTFAIDDFINRTGAKRAVIIGGGFIGLEMSENLHERGLDVTILQRSDHILPTLDNDMSSILRTYLVDHGINILLNSKIEGFKTGDSGISTMCAGRDPLESDFVVMSVGVRPDSKLAESAGLELGLKNSIAVDSHMRTSDPNIYAVGDAVQVANFITGQGAVIPLAGPANKQGRIAADNICGIQSTYKGSQGSAIMKAFDMTAASTGLTSKQAQAAGIDFDYAVTIPAPHATYYPGGRNMTLKVLFGKADGRIIGAQIVGFTGVDKRIDVLASAIRSGLTATDLTELELAYAPPYSSAKDPVNMIGYVIENLIAGKVEQTHWEDLETDLDGAILLDVRTVGEYSRGHIDGSINIPLDELRPRLSELDKSKPLLVYCHSAMRSYIACRILMQNGYHCKNISGGYGFYSSTKSMRGAIGGNTRECGLPIE